MSTALAPIISRETVTSYRWQGQYLLRTRTVLASRQPGVQFIESEVTTEVNYHSPDYAEALAYADALAHADFEAEMEGK